MEACSRLSAIYKTDEKRSINNIAMNFKRETKAYFINI